MEYSETEEWKKTMLDQYETMTKRSSYVSTYKRSYLYDFLNKITSPNYKISSIDIINIINIAIVEYKPTVYNKDYIRVYKTVEDDLTINSKDDLSVNSEIKNIFIKAELIAKEILPIFIKINVIPFRIDSFFNKFLIENNNLTMLVYFYIVILSLERYKNKMNKPRLDYYITMCYKYNKLECAKIISGHCYFYMIDKVYQLQPTEMINMEDYME